MIGADTATICTVDGLCVRVAQSEQEYREIAHLRYAAYVQEQRKIYPEADHQARLLRDSLDASGETIYVAEGNSVLGTVRANWLDCEKTHVRYSTVFQSDQFSDVPRAHVSVCSRLAVVANRRNAVIRRLLFNAIYERGLKRNTRLSFVTCAPSLVRIFRRYGFREYAPPIHDPVAHTLHRMLLVLADLDYLSSIGSPFHAIALKAGLVAGDRVDFGELFCNVPPHARYRDAGHTAVPT